MAKKRSRGADREPTRADLKALERRTAATVAGAATGRVTAADVPAGGAVSPHRGVLPPRASRVVVAATPLSREQEIAFIGSDLRRLAILAALMVVIIVVLAIFLR